MNFCHLCATFVRYLRTGSVCKRKSPRQRSILTEVALEDEKKPFRESPTESLQKLSAQTSNNSFISLLLELLIIVIILSPCFNSK